MSNEKATPQVASTATNNWPATKKRRILVKMNLWLDDEPMWNVLNGSGNMDSVVYTGSLRNCLNIKASYLSTGEFTDESPDPSHRG